MQGSSTSEIIYTKIYPVPIVKVTRSLPPTIMSYTVQPSNYTLTSLPPVLPNNQISAHQDTTDTETCNNNENIPRQHAIVRPFKRPNVENYNTPSSKKKFL